MSLSPIHLIQQQLDAFSAVQVQYNGLEEECIRSICAACPEVAERIVSIAEEFTSLRVTLDAEIKTREAAIKAAVLEKGFSVKGTYLQAAWSTGRTTWDTKGLTQYSETHPELRQYLKHGNPYVILRAVAVHRPLPGIMFDVHHRAS